MTKRHVDQFNVGDVYRSHGRTVTEADIVNYTCFAGLKVPAFIDEEFAKRTRFGGRIAPGLMTATIATGLLEEILGPYLVAALELNEFKFTVPVKPGDTLRATVTVEDKRDLSDGERAIFIGRVRVYNQRKEQVMEFSEKLMVRRFAPKDADE